MINKMDDKKTLSRKSIFLQQVRLKLGHHEEYLFKKMSLGMEKNQHVARATSKTNPTSAYVAVHID